MVLGAIPYLSFFFLSNVLQILCYNVLQIQSTKEKKNEEMCQINRVGIDPGISAYLPCLANHYTTELQMFFTMINNDLNNYLGDFPNTHY